MNGFYQTVWVKITSLTFFWGTHRPVDTVLQLNEVLGNYIVNVNGDGIFTDSAGTPIP